MVVGSGGGPGGEWMIEASFSYSFRFSVFMRRRISGSLTRLIGVSQRLTTTRRMSKLQFGVIFLAFRRRKVTQNEDFLAANCTCF